MNRNVESHFAENPVNLDISRSKFDRSCTVKFTGNAGLLIPWFVDECLPGDTFKIKTSKVIRLQTLLKPIMDEVYADFHWFFIPWRLVWNDAKAFFGETSSPWISPTDYTIPRISGTFPVGSVADYMGVPVGVATKVNALPFRCYDQVWNDWFRDVNLQQASSLDKSSNDANYQANYPYRGGNLRPVAKYHDYFTSALPAPQRGPSVEIPVASGGLFPVMTGDWHGNSSMPEIPMANYALSSDGLNAGYTRLTGEDNYAWKYVSGTTISGNGPNGETVVVGKGNDSGDIVMAPGNLWANLDWSSAQNPVATTVSDLRMAFQMQKFYEKSARSGNRYTDFVLGQFGVRSPDARLQRSEYLGGNRVPLHIEQVVNQTDSTASSAQKLGTLGAFSWSSDQHEDFVKSFTEHGYILGTVCLRYKHSYSQGQNALWNRRTKFDLYYPVFANLSEQPILNKEIYVSGDATTDDEVFGYQEAWASYRYCPDRVAGELRPGISNSLASWHLGDYYTTTPALSDTWIREDKTNVDRVLAVTSSVSQQALFDIYVENTCVRPMPLYSIPGLIDHH